MRLRYFVERLKYNWMLARTKRTNSNCSLFMRNAVQLETLAHGPVLEHVLAGGKQKIRIVVLGCSYGPEPVSISSVLLRERPEVDFQVDGYDVDDRSLEFARKGVYEPRHIAGNPDLKADFLEHAFVRIGEDYSVSDVIRSRITYHHGDATDENLLQSVGMADIVFAQHFLYHLPPASAEAAFSSIVGLLPAHGVLFVDGMDLNLKQKLVKKLGLKVLDYKIEETHECSRRSPWAASWPYNYYGLEPMLRSGDWKTRYATIYMRS